jgi:Protein of unknown function DUF72
MSEKPHTDIIVAARGWAHAAWAESFYPEDLPEDWQLSYYSNEFRGVVVPAADFAAVDPLEVERWAEDTSEDFIVYLEVEDPLTDWAAFAQTIKPLGSQLGGILLRPREVDADLAMLAGSLDAACALAPVCLLLPEGVVLSQSGRDLLAEQRVETCWEGHQAEPQWLSGGLAVVRVTGSNHYTPRQWRETIEACLRCHNHSDQKRHVLLMVEHAAPDLDALRAGMMIGDMLVIPDI